MDHFVIWIKGHTGWLYTQIYENPIFFIDFWSFAHLWSGFVVFSALLALRYKRPWMWLIIYLTMYEIVELLMLYFSNHVFKPETIKDQFTDIFVGILGGGVSYLYLNYRTLKRIGVLETIDFESLFVAETVSFLWVDRPHFFIFQPYQESSPSMVNYLWRILLGYLLLRMYARFRKTNGNYLRDIMLFTSAYFALYILSGFLTGKYNINILSDKPLISDSTQFDISYFLYQLWYPFLMILSYRALYRLLIKATEELGKRYPAKEAVGAVFTLPSANTL